MGGIIYLVTNKVNQKVYVGQTTKGLPRRRYEHLRKARYDDDVYFHKALRKYGEEQFAWQVVDHAHSKEELNEKERYWIRFYGSSNSRCGYNQTFGGEGGLLTPEALQKISKSGKGRIPWNKGIPRTEETKRKISKANRGRQAWNMGVPISEEQKEKQRRTMIGRVRSEEAKQKTSLSLKKYYETHSVSDEIREKHRVAGIGRKMNKETREKISASLRGKHPSEETRKKLSSSHLGTKRNDATKKKMGISAKKAAIKRGKLTEKDITEIRKRAENGELQSKIAESYGVARTVVTNIKNGKTWAWIR